ncbi:MAG TPA: phage/plasmid primase, P4 family, partial [Anaerolineae bacterium]|nr:phage/plasmid primase, P4 family [Anaerolineae bacterium]
GIAPLPDALLKLLTAPDTKLTPTNGNGHQNGFTLGDDEHAPYVQGAIDGELAKLRSAVNGTRNHTLYVAARNLAELGVSHAELESLLEPVALEIGLTERETRATIESGYRAGIAKPRTIPTFDSFPTNGNGHNAPNTPPAQQWLPIAAILQAFERNETGDAELLAQLYTDRIAFDHSEREWYQFAIHAWQRDQCDQVRHIISSHIAAQYAYARAELIKQGKAPDDEIVKGLHKRESALRFRGRKDNILREAQGQPALALTGDEWDTDPMLLAVSNGVLNLRADAFEFRAGQPRDYVRAVVATEWRGLDAPAPRWEQFLREIFADDEELIAFMQRWFGYCITGKTNEDAYVVLFGENGRNGKRILTETIARVIGSYAHIGDEDLLIHTRERSAGSPKQFLVDLFGKRLVLLSETEEGARFNLARVKNLVGSDIIAARGVFARRGQQLQPTWKITLSTNRMPHADPDDESFYSRLAIVKFTQRFVVNPVAPHEHPRDPNLIETLKSESSGILAWLVRGALEWQQKGLAMPESVRAATNEYREGEDTLTQYIHERLFVGENASVKGKPLYQDYCEWCEDNGLTPMKGTKFGKLMGKRFKKETTRNGVVYLGIGLLQSDEADWIPATRKDNSKVKISDL